ncbi:MAG: hypothetical protein ABI672_06970 [Vicinamibacteria bacterium]
MENRAYFTYALDVTMPTGSRSFVTRELTARENILQAGWAKSASSLLDRLDVKGSHLTIRRRDGAVDELEQGAFRCTSYRTGSGRRLFVIRASDGRTIRFLEMEGVLSVEEWDAIADEVLGATPLNLNALFLRGAVAIVPGMLAAVMSVGIVGAIFRLEPEQLVFSAPLSLGLMAGWIAALWYGLTRLNWPL